MKIGIFDDIVSPIKDALQAVVSGVEKPIRTVESIFGEVINFTKEFIQSVVNMIEDMRNLFNARQVETIFLYPFKEAALTALKDIETIYQLMISVGKPSIDGVEETLMAPIDAVYQGLRVSARAVLGSVNNIIVHIKEDLESAGHAIIGDFVRLKALIDSLPVEMKILGRKIRQELSVVGDDAFDMAMPIPEFGVKAGNFAFSEVRKTGTVVAADFSALESGIKRRFANEHAVLDLLYIAIIGGIIAALVTIFMVTHSIKVIVIILIMMVVSILIFAITELLIGDVV